MCRALRQGVSVTQIVDLNVFDVVSVRNVDFGVGFAVCVRMRSGAISLKMWVSFGPEFMLGSEIITERIGGTSTC